jgi:hypothetical protein
MLATIFPNLRYIWLRRLDKSARAFRFTVRSKLLDGVAQTWPE